MAYHLGIKYLPLYDGNNVPQVGLAAFFMDSQLETIAAIKEKFALGVRHFEVAEMYGNCHTVMGALRECLSENNLVRGDIFITLKVWPKNRKPKDILANVRETMVFSGLEYLDVVLVHAPIDVENRADQWAALETLKDTGLARSLGAANITSVQLQDLLKNCTTIPAVFGMEVSPFHQNQELTEFLNDSSMIVYCNEFTAKGIRNGHPTLNALKEELRIDSIEILLARWCTSKGYALLLPAGNRSLNVEASLLVEPLDSKTMECLDALEESFGTCWVPIEKEESEDGNQ